MNALDTRIDQWVEAGLLSPEKASELRHYDDEHPPPADSAESAPAVETADHTGARALALVGEVVGYLGAVLVVVAVSFLVRRTWGDIPEGGRIALVAVLVAAVALAGVLASRSASHPAQRLASVLLLATVGLTAWLAWLVAEGPIALDGDATARAVASVTATAALGIYVWRRRTLAELAAGASLAALVAAVFAPHGDGAPVGMFVAWSCLGLAWVALAAAHIAEPAPAGLIAGGLLAVLPLSNGDGGATGGWMLAAQVVLAAALVTVAALRRPLVLLIIPGAIGLLEGVPSLIDHVWGDALAVWVGVLVTGLALVGLAVRMVRGRRGPPPAGTGS